MIPHIRLDYYKNKIFDIIKSFVLLLGKVSSKKCELHSLMFMRELFIMYMS